MTAPSYNTVQTKLQIKFKKIDNPTLRGRKSGLSFMLQTYAR